jgi:type I restriction enzyme, S subunit
MNLETFFEKFHLFADAPNAVAKMRELVLRLAFSGGLSGKNSNDDGALSEWETRTIESICSLITPGFACSRNHQIENGHVHLRTHNISTLGTLNFDLLVRINPKMVDPQKSSIRRGDILFNNTNSQELVGKTSLVDRDYDYAFSNHITRLRLKEGIYPGFVAFYLTLLRNSGYFAKICTRWINQAAVNTETLKEESIVLPPLAEQKRIVAKVDELMALCDRLEAQQQERETRHAALARASLARFADAPTPANLNFIFHKSYDIAPADLRKTILTLAVQGKLVPQDPNDEPAEAILKAANALFEHLVSVKKLSAPKPLPSILEDDLPFSLPTGWASCRLGQLMRISSGDGLVSKKMNAGPIPVYGGNGVTGYHDTCNVSKPTLVIGRVGFYCGSIHVTPEKAWVTDNAFITTFDEEHVEIEFMRWLLKATDLRQRDNATAQPVISGSKIYPTVLGIPPLAEQRRIVAKVDELMALVDALENQLGTARASAEKLMEAVVAELSAEVSHYRGLLKFRIPNSKNSQLL